MKPVQVWVAVSAAGYVAPVVGISFTRSDLVDDYKARVGKTLKESGYRPIRAELHFFKETP